MFTEFKGSLVEQYVCQQLVGACGLTPYYWSADNSRGEADFLVQSDGATYPIEVKAEENLRAKSLRAFSERYENVRPRRFSLSGLRDEGGRGRRSMRWGPKPLEVSGEGTCEIPGCHLRHNVGAGGGDAIGGRSRHSSSPTPFR